MQREISRVLPVEKQHITIGAVCLLIGSVAGMAMRVGVRVNAIDTLTQTSEKQQEQYRHDQESLRLDLRAITDDISTLKAATRFQGAMIEQMKSDQEFRDEQRIRR